MRVQVFLYSFYWSELQNRLENNFSILLESVQALLVESKVPANLQIETLECINEAFCNTQESKTGKLELLHAMCWFLEANCQKTEIESFTGWKYRYFQEFGLNRLALTENPFWLPQTLDAAPNAFYLCFDSGDISKSIKMLQNDDSGGVCFEEFQEARDELIEVLELVEKSKQDSIIVALT